MKTIKATGQLAYRFETDQQPTVPAGKVHVHVVQYQTFELDAAEFEAMTFQIHDANSPEARTIAELVNL
jgi:hypothetical protein